MKKQRFVKAEILKDGTARLIDDDGEEFHVEMRTDMAWPMVSRLVRPFEMREMMEKNVRERDKPKFDPFTLIPGGAA